MNYENDHFPPPPELWVREVQVTIPSKSYKILLLSGSKGKFLLLKQIQTLDSGLRGMEPDDLKISSWGWLPQYQKELPWEKGTNSHTQV